MDDPTLLDRWDIIPNSSKMTTRQACQSFYERLPELVPVDFRYSSIRPDVLPIAEGEWSITYFPICTVVGSSDLNYSEHWTLKCNSTNEAIWLTHIAYNNTFSLSCANLGNTLLTGGYMKSGKGHWNESQVFLKFDHVASDRLKGEEASKWKKMRAAMLIKFQDLLDSKEGKFLG